jgi:hypothetical protein
MFYFLLCFQRLVAVVCIRIIAPCVCHTFVYVHRRLPSSPDLKCPTSPVLRSLREGIIHIITILTISPLSSHYLATVCSRSAHFPPTNRSAHPIYPICPLSAHYLPTICPLSAHYLPTICPLSAHYLPTICPLSAHYPPTNRSSHPICPRSLPTICPPDSSSAQYLAMVLCPGPPICTLSRRPAPPSLISRYTLFVYHMHLRHSSNIIFDYS